MNSEKREDVTYRKAVDLHTIAWPVKVKMDESGKKLRSQRIARDLLGSMVTADKRATCRTKPPRVKLGDEQAVMNDVQLSSTSTY